MPQATLKEKAAKKAANTTTVAPAKKAVAKKTATKTATKAAPVAKKAAISKTTPTAKKAAPKTKSAPEVKDEIVTNDVTTTTDTKIETPVDTKTTETTEAPITATHSAKRTFVAIAKTSNAKWRNIKAVQLLEHIVNGGYISQQMFDENPEKYPNFVAGQPNSSLDTLPTKRTTSYFEPAVAVNYSVEQCKSLGIKKNDGYICVLTENAEAAFNNLKNFHAQPETKDLDLGWTILENAVPRTSIELPEVYVAPVIAEIPAAENISDVPTPEDIEAAITPVKEVVTE